MRALGASCAIAGLLAITESYGGLISRIAAFPTIAKRDTANVRSRVTIPEVPGTNNPLPDSPALAFAAAHLPVRCSTPKAERRTSIDRPQASD